MVDRAQKMDQSLWDDLIHDLWSFNRRSESLEDIQLAINREISFCEADTIVTEAKYRKFGFWASL
jgi:hypothetical protein